MKKFDLRAKNPLYIMLLIMVITILVRVWGVNFGLPNWYLHTDETLTFRKVLGIEKNPFFNHDPLSLFHFVLNVSEYLYGRIMLLLKTDYKRGILCPGIMMMWRIITALISSISVYLTYLVGKKLYNSKVGLFAAAVLCFSLSDVFIAHIVKQDTYNQLLGLLAFLGSILIYKKGDLKYYFITGLIIGFAVVIKLNALVFLCFYIPAHILRYSTLKEAFDIKQIKYKVPVSVIALLLGFYLGFPYDLFKPPQHIIDDFLFFLQRGVLDVDKTELAKIDHSININSIISKLKWINIYFSNSGLWYSIYIASLGGILIALKRHRKEDIILLFFPVVYLIILSLRSVIYDRWMTLLTPFLAIFAAIFLYEFYYFLTNRFRLQNKQKASVMILLLGVVIGYPAFRVFLFDYSISRQDTRETAYRWIKENLSKDELIFTVHLATSGLHALGMKLAEDGYLSETLGAGISPIGYKKELFRFKNGIMVLSSSNSETELTSLIRKKSKLVKKISNYWFENEFFGKRSLGLNHFSDINHLHNPTIEIYRLPEVDPVNKDRFKVNYSPGEMKWSSMKLIDDPESNTKKSMYADKKRQHHIAGPHRLFPPGMYKVIYRLKAENITSDDQIATAFVSKAGLPSRFVILEILGSNFIEPGRYQTFVLPLFLKRAVRLETPIVSYKKAEFWVDTITVEELRSEREFQELIRKTGYKLSSFGSIISIHPKVYSFKKLKKFTNGKIIPDPQTKDGFAIFNGNIWGPYEDLPEGDYTVTWCLKTDNIGYDEVISILDIAIGGTGTALIQKHLKGTDFKESNKYQEFSLPLNITTNTQLEFRVHYKGKTNLWFDRIEVKPL